MLTSFQSSFEKLKKVNGLEDLVDLHSRRCVIVSVQKLVDLKGDYCNATLADGRVCGKILEHWAKYVGTCIKIDWKCSIGHYGKWESSEILAYNRYSKV